MSSSTTKPIAVSKLPTIVAALHETFYNDWPVMPEKFLLDTESDERLAHDQVRLRLLHEFIVLKNGKPAVPNFQESTPEYWKDVQVIGLMACPNKESKWFLWSGRWELELPGKHIVVVYIPKVSGMVKEADPLFRNGVKPALWLESAAGFSYGMMAPMQGHEAGWYAGAQTWAGDEAGPGGDPSVYALEDPVAYYPDWWHNQKTSLPAAKKEFARLQRMILKVEKEYEKEEAKATEGSDEDEDRSDGSCEKGTGKGKGKAKAKAKAKVGGTGAKKGKGKGKSRQSTGGKRPRKSDADDRAGPSTSAVAEGQDLPKKRRRVTIKLKSVIPSSNEERACEDETGSASADADALGSEDGGLSNSQRDEIDLTAPPVVTSVDSSPERSPALPRRPPAPSVIPSSPSSPPAVPNDFRSAGSSAEPFSESSPPKRAAARARLQEEVEPLYVPGPATQQEGQFSLPPPPLLRSPDTYAGVGPPYTQRDPSSAGNMRSGFSQDTVMTEDGEMSAIESAGEPSTSANPSSSVMMAHRIDPAPPVPEEAITDVGREVALATIVQDRTDQAMDDAVAPLLTRSEQLTVDVLTMSLDAAGGDRPAGEGCTPKSEGVVSLPGIDYLDTAGSPSEVSERVQSLTPTRTSTPLPPPQLALTPASGHLVVTVSAEEDSDEDPLGSVSNL